MTNLPFTGIFKVTCEYGRKGSWAAGYHTGIDLVGNNKTVYNVCDGVVTMARYYGSYGNCVKVKDSINGNIYLFAHLASISVKIGQKVSRTSKIGIMGATGNAKGAHLHFEIRTPKDIYGQQYDPTNYLGIPNKVANNLNSNNYQLSNGFKVGDRVEISKPVITGYTEGNRIIVQGKNPNNEKQWWINKTNISDNKIVGIGYIAAISGDSYLIDLKTTGSDQFWVSGNEIKKA